MVMLSIGKNATEILVGLYRSNSDVAEIWRMRVVPCVNVVLDSCARSPNARMEIYTFGRQREHLLLAGQI